MSPHFGSVVAIDPSAGMIKQASSTTKDTKITFKQGSSEDLSFLSNSSVDMAVAGQAAHWFDYSRAWSELSRVVKPGGSLAFWGYKDNILFGHPAASKIFDKFCYGEGEIEPGMEGMHKYWERPGREIVRKLLTEVEPPAAQWEDVKRIMCDVSSEMTELPDEETAWLRKKTTLGGFEGYLRTFSSVQGWKDAHPDWKSRAEGGEGDLVDICLDRLVESEVAWKAMGENWRDAEVELVWGTYILMARRK